MATYGRGQMLGAGIDPRMFVQDYSGFARAGAIQGQGMAQLGADIGDIGKQFGEFKKQQAEQEKQVKSAELVAKAISDSFPSLAPMAQEAMFILGDKNNPLSDRLAAAQAIETSLKIGSGLLAQQAEQGLAERRLGLQERELKMSEAAASAPPESKWTSFESKRDVDGKQYTARIRQNQFGIIEGSDGKQYKTIDDFWAGRPMESFSAGGQSPLPTGEGYMDPVFLPGDYVPTDSTMPIELGDGSPTPSAAQEAEFNRNTPVVPVESSFTDFQEPARQIENALGEERFYVPSGAVETSRAAGEQQEIVLLSPAQVQDIIAKGGKVSGDVLPDGGVSNAKVTYQQPSGMSVRTTPEGGVEFVQGPGVGQTIKEQRVQEAQKRMGFENTRAITTSLAQAIPMIETELSSNPLIARGQATLATALPATEVGRINTMLETARVATSRESINALRNSSLTGSAGGTITEREWPKFENRMGKMEIGVDPKDLVNNSKLTGLNQFEAAHGTPEDVVKLLDSGKITQDVYDEYVKEYLLTRQNLQIPVQGIDVPGAEWSKLNPKLLEKSKEGNQVQSQASPEASGIMQRLQELRSRLSQ